MTKVCAERSPEPWTNEISALERFGTLFPVQPSVVKANVSSPGVKSEIKATLVQFSSVAKSNTPSLFSSYPLIPSAAPSK